MQKKKKGLVFTGLISRGTISSLFFFLDIRKSDFFLNDRWLLSVFTVFPPFYQRWVELTLDCHWIEVRSVDPLDPLSTKWDDCRKLEVFLFRQWILTLHQRLLRLPFHGVRISYLCGCARNLTVELPPLDFNFLFSLKEFSNSVSSKSPSVVSALWACGFAWPSCGFFYSFVQPLCCATTWIRTHFCIQYRPIGPDLITMDAARPKPDNKSD